MPRKSFTLMDLNKTADLSLRMGTVYDRPKLTGTQRIIVHKLNKFARIHGNIGLSVICKKSRNFSHVQWVFGAGKFQYAIRIFKGEKGVAMATEFEPKLAKIALISVLWKK